MKTNLTVADLFNIRYIFSDNLLRFDLSPKEIRVMENIINKIDLISEKENLEIKNKK